MIQDIRYAFRSLRGSPVFTIVALIVLTLGIGAGTAIFSMVDAVVLRSLPYDESDRLVAVGTRGTQTGRFNSYNTPQDFLDFRARQEFLSAVTAITSSGDFTVREADHSERLRVQRVTAEFFDVFRVVPRIGRPFNTSHEIDGNHRVAVLSDGFWRRRFGADPNVTGKSVTFESGTWEVIGVMPRSFDYPVGRTETTDMWVPFVVPENQRKRGNSRNYYLQLVGRLKDGASIDQAADNIESIASGLAAEFPHWFRDRVGAVQSLHDTLVGRVRGWMLMLLGAVGFVLLVACVNVANLMLARATARGREISLRSALGADRWQVARGMLVEGLVLTAAATILALLVAWLGVLVLRASLPESLPRIAAIAIDLRILGAAVLAALLTGLSFSLYPALKFSRPNLADALREGGRGTTAGIHPGMHSALIVTEVALAVVLLVGSGLFARSFIRLVRVEIGLDIRNVLTVGVYPRADFSTPEGIRQAAERASSTVPPILEAVKSLPGVEAVSIISGGLPLSGSWSRTDVRVPGRDQEFEGDDSVDIRHVTAEYARVVGISVLRGRYLRDTDVSSSEPVVVLNEEAAKRYLGDRDPVGAQIEINGKKTVVGVVGNVRLGGPESAVRPEAYVPTAQSSFIGGELVVKTTVEGASLIDPIKKAVWSSLPDSPIDEVVTMEALYGRLIAQRQFNMVIVGLFGALALVIAAAGIYGVMAYIVTQRTQEIGVRMALGALPRSVLRMILWRASAFLILGLAVGLTGAWALGSSIRSFLFEVDPYDPLVYAAVGALLFVAGLVAAYVPARRAASVDPLVALRD